MTIWIVEDEPQAALVLADLIKSVRPDARVTKMIESVAQMLSELTHKQGLPDLIFMDIQLADGMCFEIFAHTELMAPVIFCTAYDQYALQAFKANGIEYLLKPVKETDISGAFVKYDRLREAFPPNADVIKKLQVAIEGPKMFKKSVLIRHRESYIPLAIEKIMLFILENEVVFAWDINHQKYPVFKSMDELESTIDSESFYRINRQTLINRQAIVELQPYFNRKMVVRVAVKLHEQLIVSRLKVSPFLKWIEGS